MAERLHRHRVEITEYNPDTSHGTGKPQERHGQGRHSKGERPNGEKCRSDNNRGNPNRRQPLHPHSNDQPGINRGCNPNNRRQTAKGNREPMPN